MKRILAALLSCALIITSCEQSATSQLTTTSATTTATSLAQSEEIIETTLAQVDETQIAEEVVLEEGDGQGFDSLGDQKLLDYIERTTYSGLLESLPADEYIIENVSTLYISKEYLEEVEYNAKANIWYGYTLDEIKEQYGDTPYIFTVGSNGSTILEPFKDYDDTYDKILKNVAIGSGVILVCVTITVVTGGLGTAPAINLIFAASAKSAATFAASSAVISGTITTIATGIQTGNLEESLKQGALSASEGFKWGAIGGSITGGATQLISLKTATGGGLTLNEAASIIKESGLSSNFVKQIHSMDEYNELVRIAQEGGLALKDMDVICNTMRYPVEIVKRFRSIEEADIYFKQATLVSETIGGKKALIRSIDLTYKSELAGKTVTNLERMQRGYAAIDPSTGLAYELHHIGQSVDSPLAILTRAEHMGGGNNKILHDLGKQGVQAQLSNGQWAAQRSEFWKAMATFLQ